MPSRRSIAFGLARAKLIKSERSSNAFESYDYAYGPGVDQAGGEIDYAGRPIRRQFGNLLLSRQPIVYCRHHLLPKSASIGPLSIQRSALECAVNFGDTSFRFINTHLTHINSETRVPSGRSVTSHSSRTRLMRVFRSAGQ